jgi:hypothetical protein
MRGSTLSIRRGRPSAILVAAAGLIAAAIVGVTAAVASPPAPVYTATPVSTGVSTPNGCQISLTVTWAHSDPVKRVQYFSYRNPGTGWVPSTNYGQSTTLDHAKRKGSVNVFHFVLDGDSYYVDVRFLDATDTEVGSVVSDQIPVSC